MVLSEVGGPTGAPAGPLTLRVFSLLEVDQFWST